MHPATPDTGVPCSSKTDWTALKEKCVHPKALKAIMRGEHKEGRYYAAMRAMAEAPAARGEALRVLRGALRDSTRGPKRPGVEKTEGWVVRWAPLMLEHVPDRDRLPILRAALRYRGDANVRTNAVDAIGRFNISPEEKLVLLSGASKDKSAQVRWRVGRALGPIDSPRAKDLMKVLAKDKSWWVRREAAVWLRNGPYERATHDARDAVDRCNSAAPGGLSRQGDSESAARIANLASLLADPEPVVRLCAVNALRYGDRRVASHLEAAMQSSDFRVSLKAAGAILGREP
jgi:HEAT repeat protein